MNKQRNAQKARQAKALKKARRSKPYKAKPFHQNSMVSESGFPEKDRVFWLAHGCNFLASDYGDGAWEPMFPEIYREGFEANTDYITNRLVPLIETEDPLEVWQQAVLSYALQEAVTYCVFMLKAEELLKQAGMGEEAKAEARKPHQGLVWQMFHDLVLKNVEANMIAQAEYDNAQDSLVE